MNRLIQATTKTQYTIGYRVSDTSLLDNPKASFTALPLGDNCWYADPFPYKKDGKIYVFSEVFMLDKGYAGIGFSVFENGTLTQPKIIIDIGKHMSFPCIFEHDDEIYMVPETVSSGKIMIFKCVSFPDKWEELYSLNSSSGFYDTAIFNNNGKWYAFSSEATQDLYGSRLYLFELSDEGQLKIKSKVPLSEDYRISRQAGNVFKNGEKLYRVAQDCSHKEYGRSIVFNKINNLNAQNYSEEMSLVIEPHDVKILNKDKSWIVTGIHTFGRIDDFEVVDFKISTLSAKATIQKSKIVAKQLLHIK